MKTRIAAAVASLVVASFGTAAFAQATPQTAPPSSSPYTSSSSQTSSSMSNNMDNMSSSTTEQKIKRALTSHGITATNVNISFNDGTATLSGTVATHRDISKARRAAMRVRGVKHVDTSNLKVRGKSDNMEH